MSAALVIDDQTVQNDTHKIDYIKGRVAFDLEWNSKDQTFDRDLFAFRSFFDYDKISVGILVTRSERLNPLFRELGISQKYGASTTHLGKLLPRLQAGRGGGCPLLIFGITELLVEAASMITTAANDLLKQVQVNFGTSLADPPWRY